MATGRRNTSAGQTGEYLVAAKLGRRSLIAITLTGNVPHHDIVASDEKPKHVSAQVNAGRETSWQFGDITFEGQRHIVERAKKCPVHDLFVEFVRIAQVGNDSFNIIPWLGLRNLLVKQHTVSGEERRYPPKELEIKAHRDFPRTT